MSEPRIAVRFAECWSGWIDCHDCGVGQAVSASNKPDALAKVDAWLAVHQVLHDQRDAKTSEAQAKIDDRARIVEAGKEALDRFNEPHYNDPAINPYMAEVLAYCRLLEAEAPRL